MIVLRGKKITAMKFQMKEYPCIHLTVVADKWYATEKGTVSMQDSGCGRGKKATGAYKQSISKTCGNIIR